MSIQQAVDAIIRPPRSTYDIKKLPKVLETDDEEDGGGIFVRIPMELELPRNKLVLRGSIYHSGLMKLSEPGPCVVYMHGNASSQLEGQFLVPNLCPHHVFVVCFDFIGCGCSDGDYVSLGYYEKGDTEFLLNFLKEKYNLGPFVLWGRSMGAATALIVENPNVIGIISDSGFTSIRNMVKAIAKQHKVGTMFMKPTLWMLKSKVETLAGFDFNTVSPLKVVPERKVPVIFAQATDDKLIPFEHCEQLFKAYGGTEKRMIKLTGGHNGRRPLEFIRDGVKFALERFGLPTRGLIISPCRNLMKSDFHFESFEKMIGNTAAFSTQSLENEVAKETHQNQASTQPKQYNFNSSEDEDYEQPSTQSFHFEEEDEAVEEEQALEEEQENEEDHESGEENENAEEESKENQQEEPKDEQQVPSDVKTDNNQESKEDEKQEDTKQDLEPENEQPKLDVKQEDVTGKPEEVKQEDNAEQKEEEHTETPENVQIPNEQKPEANTEKQEENNDNQPQDEQQELQKNEETSTPESNDQTPSSNSQTETPNTTPESQ